MVRQFLLGLLGVGALALLVVKLPSCMLEKADKSSTTCFELLDVEGGTDPTVCRRDGWLAIPARMPHTKRKAEAVAKDIEHSVYYRVHQLGTARAATDALRLRAIMYAQRSGKADDLSALGAYEQAAALDAPPDDRYHASLNAALVLGNTARAKTLVMQGKPTGEAAGALACLLGARERGLALLAEHVKHSLSFTQARIAGLHCGATPSSFSGLDPTAEGDIHYEAAMVVRAFDPAFQAGRRGVLARWLRDEVSLFPHTKLAGNALALVSSELDPAAVVRLVAAEDGVPQGGVVKASPWFVLRGRSYSDDRLDYLPPSWLATAAQRVEDALAKPVPKLSVKDDDKLRFELETERIDGAFLKDPHAMLRRVAARLHAFAASYALRGNQRAFALGEIAKLRALDPDALDLGVLELASGEPKRALETLARWEAKAAADDPLRGIAIVNRVLALAALGDHAGAHAAAKQGNQRDPIIGWLVLGTAIAAKVPVGELAIPQKLDATDDAARWAHAIATNVEPPHSYDLEAEVVLPAVFVVMGHAATVAGGDAEAYLDDRLSARDLPSRAFMRARAEAARWRGDAASAKRWDDRATALEALIVDDHAAALAGIAGLW